MALFTSSATSASSPSSPPTSSLFDPSTPSCPPSTSSTANTTSTSTSAPRPALSTFAFPFGPSTRFHSRERARSQHLQSPRSYTHAVAPTLSTAARAHRRAHSSATILTTTDPSAPASRPADSARRPHRPRPSPAVTMSGPFTPAKRTSRSRPGSILQDSPFSDYFTDEARSTPGDDLRDPSASIETQQLLVRLSKIQVQLMRDAGDERRARRLVERKITELDNELDSLHSQTRLPPDMEDSGLFMEEDDHPEVMDHTPGGRRVPALPFRGIDDVRGILSDRPTCAHQSAESEFLLCEAQRVLDSVTNAQSLLQRHQRELRDMHTKFDAALEEREHTIRRLRKENESLKADLSFDHSDLLFLKMQFRALEVQLKSLEVATSVASDAGGLDADDEIDPSASPESRESVRLFRRSRLQQHIERWRGDVDDISERMRRRRLARGVSSPDLRRDNEAMESDEPQKKESGKGIAIDEYKRDEITAEEVHPDTDVNENSAHDHDSSNEDFKKYGDHNVTDGRDMTGSIFDDDEEASTDRSSQSTQITTVTVPSEPMESIKNDFAQSDSVIDEADQKVEDRQSNETSSNPPQHTNEDELDGAREDQNDDETDCAITTSSESEDNNLDASNGSDDDYETIRLGSTERDDLTKSISLSFSSSSASPSTKKTAWQDLWEGLTNFAGLGDDDRFD